MAIRRSARPTRAVAGGGAEESGQGAPGPVAVLRVAGGDAFHDLGRETLVAGQAAEERMSRASVPPANASPGAR